MCSTQCSDQHVNAIPRDRNSRTDARENQRVEVVRAIPLDSSVAFPYPRRAFAEGWRWGRSNIYAANAERATAEERFRGGRRDNGRGRRRPPQMQGALSSCTLSEQGEQQHMQLSARSGCLLR